jgi:predicted RNA-binding protein associated with RNAse of E/G family
MAQITVRKLDHTGREVVSYPADILVRSSDTIVLRTAWDREPVDLNFAVLEPDDRWTETFYSDRWYNIFEIRASDGRLKGWYCNVTRPAKITHDEVLAEDLALDLWVEPDGTVHVIDEDEFEELELSPTAREAAREALGQLMAMVARGAAPFDGR